MLRSAFARYTAAQEAEQHAGIPQDQPWYPPPDPEPLHDSGTPIRLWNQVQSALKTQLSRNEFTTWIRRATLISVEQGVATIMAPTALAQQVIENRYGSMLRDLLRMYTGEALELRVILNPNAQAQPAPESAPSIDVAAPSAEPTPDPQSPVPSLQTGSPPRAGPRCRSCCAPRWPAQRWSMARCAGARRI